VSYETATTHTWHQSSIAKYLRCGRAFELRYLREVTPDHRVSGYAAPIGTAIHDGAALVLTRRRAKDAPRVTADELRGEVMGSFLDQIDRVHREGGDTDPDKVEAACSRLEDEHLPRLVALADDPRLSAIRWMGVEDPFHWADGDGRRFGGTIDAWGVALEDVPDWTTDRRGPVGLARGEVVVIDWKTGVMEHLDWVSRSNNVQLAFYKTAVSRLAGGRRVRAFLGILRDYDGIPRCRIEAERTNALRERGQ